MVNEHTGLVDGILLLLEIMNPFINLISMYKRVYLRRVVEGEADIFTCIDADSHQPIFAILNGKIVGLGGIDEWKSECLVKEPMM